MRAEFSRLCQAGLLVGKIEDLNPDFECYAFRKPIEVAGNHREYCRSAMRFPDALTDAPDLAFIGNRGTWRLRTDNFHQGAGLGDFERLYDDLETAIADVLEYFFGDSTWMRPVEWLARRNRELPPELAKLSDAGLLVRGCADDDPMEYSDWYSITKPASVSGNGRGSGYRGSFSLADGREVETDAPTLRLRPEGCRWTLALSEHVGGPGPGDFTRFYDSLAAAASDAFEYYFGNPSWMTPPEWVKQMTQNPYIEWARRQMVVSGSLCKRDDCGRGRIELSVFCAAHHWEMLSGEPAPVEGD